MSGDSGALRLAHRGDHRVARENTTAAVRDAVAAPGIDGVEFDVRFARDGTPILLHDATLRRVQGVRRAARTLAAAELLGHAVPPLDIVLAVVPPDAFLDVELKESPTPAFAAAAVAGRGPSGRRAVVSSFDERILATSRTLLPGWAHWLNAVSPEPAVLEQAVRLGCRGVAVAWRTITPERVAAARAAGLDVAAWTVRRRAVRDRLEALGVTTLVEGDALLP